MYIFIPYLLKPRKDKRAGNKRAGQSAALSGPSCQKRRQQQDQAQQPNLRPSQCLDGSDDISPPRIATLSSASSSGTGSISI
jgi:hypothetical protein